MAVGEIMVDSVMNSVAVMIWVELSTMVDFRGFPCSVILTIVLVKSVTVVT